jgi:E3 ubiquitin-protein ligase Topors
MEHCFLLHRINLESEEFGSHLEPFLHEKTHHFMHELVSFAKSPYDLIAYDNRVRYDWPETHPQAAQEQVGGGDTGSQPGT